MKHALIVQSAPISAVRLLSRVYGISCNWLCNYFLSISDSIKYIIWSSHNVVSCMHAVCFKDNWFISDSIKYIMIVSRI